VPNPPFLIGDIPRKAGGETDGGASTRSALLQWA
jgi:hypothetical protein